MPVLRTDRAVEMDIFANELRGDPGLTGRGAQHGLFIEFLSDNMGNRTTRRPYRRRRASSWNCPSPRARR
jgi:hypothetical protein